VTSFFSSFGFYLTSVFFGSGFFGAGVAGATGAAGVGGFIFNFESSTAFLAAFLTFSAS